MITMNSLALQGAMVACDTCPRCGDVAVTTDAGRLVARRLDGRGACTCTPDDRAAAEAEAARRVLAYVLRPRPARPARPERGATAPSVAQALKHLSRLTAPTAATPGSATGSASRCIAGNVTGSVPAPADADPATRVRRWAPTAGQAGPPFALRRETARGDVLPHEPGPMASQATEAPTDSAPVVQLELFA